MEWKSLHYELVLKKSLCSENKHIKIYFKSLSRLKLVLSQALSSVSF